MGSALVLCVRIDVQAWQGLSQDIVVMVGAMGRSSVMGILGVMLNVLALLLVLPPQGVAPPSSG